MNKIINNILCQLQNIKNRVLKIYWNSVLIDSDTSNIDFTGNVTVSKSGDVTTVNVLGSSSFEETVTNVSNIIDGNRIGTYTNEENISVDIDETITTIVDNIGSFTYTNEAGEETTITYSIPDVCEDSYTETSDETYNWDVCAANTLRLDSAFPLHTVNIQNENDGIIYLIYFKQDINGNRNINFSNDSSRTITVYGQVDSTPESISLIIVAPTTNNELSFFIQQASPQPAYTLSILDEGVEIEPETISIDFIGDMILAETDGSGNVSVKIPPPAPEPFIATYLIDGGQIAWQQDYDYSVSAVNYVILGVTYHSDGDNITLAIADPIFDRIDLVVVDTNGDIIVITGTPSANPQQPSYDPSIQIPLGFISVTANTTTDPCAALVAVYQENLGTPSEYNITSTDVSIVVNDNSDPKAGTLAIKGTNTNTTGIAYLTLATSSPTLINNVKQLDLYIKSLNSWGASNKGKGFAVQFRNASGFIGNQIIIKAKGTYGFDSSVLTGYQQVAIPMTDFGLISTSEFTEIRITAISYGGSNGNNSQLNFLIDDILLEVNCINDFNPFEETITLLQNTITGHKIGDYTNEKGEVVDINETPTTIVDNLDNTYTYTSEDGTQTIIDVTGPLYTVDNGLSESPSGNFQLGGTLIQYTTISHAGNYIEFSAGGFDRTYLKGGQYDISCNTATPLTVERINGNSPVGIFQVNNSLTGASTPVNVLTLSRREPITPNVDLNALIAFQLYTNTYNYNPGQISWGHNDLSGVDGSISEGYVRVRANYEEILNSGANDNSYIQINGSGSVLFSKYGSGAFTGTATKFLAVDANGYVIEEDAPSGGPETDPNAWHLLGNAGTVEGLNFLGTTDNVPLQFKIANIHSGKISQQNTSFGYQSLEDLTTGDFNSSFGIGSLSNLTTGRYNTSVGHNALTSLINGEENISIGLSSSQSLVDGFYNVSIGNQSLSLNVNSWANTAIGHQTLSFLTTGTNTAIGYRSLWRLVSGESNVFVGVNAGSSLYSGTGNIGIGYGGWGGVIGNVPTNTNFNCIGIGTGVYQAAYNNNYNIGIGLNSLSYNNTSSSNIAVGLESLFHLTTGSYNITSGDFVARYLWSGFNNIISGNNTALFENTNTINLADTISWTVNTGWTIGANNYTYTHAPGTTNTIELPYDWELNRVLRVVITTTGRTAGLITITAGGSTGTTGSSNSTITTYLRITNTNNLIITPTSDFNGTIQIQVYNNQVSDLTNSIIIGNNIETLDKDDDNTILIGSGINGSGSNTVVIGNDSIVSTNLGGQQILRDYGSGTFTGTATKFLAVNASGNVIEEDAPGGGGAGLVDILHSDLLTAISGNTLTAGTWYRIIDFQTVHTIYNTADTRTGATNPIIIQAIKNNELAAWGYCENNPDDIVYYEPQNNTTYIPGCTKGFIYRRINTKWNIDLPFDFMEFRFRRYKPLIAAYNAGTTYNRKQLVDNGGFIYVSKQNSNLGNATNNTTFWAYFAQYASYFNYYHYHSSNTILPINSGDFQDLPILNLTNLAAGNYTNIKQQLNTNRNSNIHFNIDNVFFTTNVKNLDIDSSSFRFNTFSGFTIENLSIKDVSSMIGNIFVSGINTGLKLEKKSSFNNNYFGTSISNVNLQGSGITGNLLSFSSSMSNVYLYASSFTDGVYGDDDAMNQVEMYNSTITTNTYTYYKASSLNQTYIGSSLNTGLLQYNEFFNTFFGSGIQSTVTHLKNTYSCKVTGRLDGTPVLTYIDNSNVQQIVLASS